MKFIALANLSGGVNAQKDEEFDTDQKSGDALIERGLAAKVDKTKADRGAVATPAVPGE